LSAATPAAAIDRPTWVDASQERGLLFAVSEIGNYDGRRGRVASYRIDANSGNLIPLSTVDSGGGGPTYLSHADGRLFVANFGSGDVGAFPIADDGRIMPHAWVQRQTGSGPLAKQKSAHPHATLLDPSGRWLLVPDMGADRIFVYRFDKAGGLWPAPTPSLSTGPGTGPRHAAFSRDGQFLYLVTEHTAEVRAFRWNATLGTLQPIQALSLDPPGTATRSAAEIVPSPDGRFLYVSNRIRDRIHVFSLDARTGLLRPVEDIHSGGERPRSFALDPSGRWLIVGNQDSQTITVYAVDAGTGRLSQRGPAVTVPEKPVSFAFFRMLSTPASPD
jgi:6-phosphogluconolactonase